MLHAYAESWLMMYVHVSLVRANDVHQGCIQKFRQGGGGGEFGIWTKEGAPGGSSVLSCEMLHSGQCYRVRCYTLVSVIV